MAAFTFKAGSGNYGYQEQEALLFFARRVAGILNKLNEKDARVLAFAIDPTLDRYVLGGWTKREVIQEAVEDMVRDQFSPSKLNTNANLWDDLIDVADSINQGIL